MNASDYNAVISLEGNAVVYREEAAELWRLPLSSIAVLGEYTTTDGPYADDYFLVFVTTPECQRFHACFYAEGRDALLAALSEHLGSPVKCALINSADLASNCVYPPHLRGHSLFRFTPVPRGGGWNKVRRLISPEYAFDFTTEVENYLGTLIGKDVEQGAASNGAPVVPIRNSGDASDRH